MFIAYILRDSPVIPVVVSYVSRARFYRFQRYEYDNLHKSVEFRIAYRNSRAIFLFAICVHDQKIWTKISVQEICNQLTCSFYGKAAILLAKHFLDRDLGPSSLIVDTRLY